MSFRKIFVATNNPDKIEEFSDFFNRLSIGLTIVPSPLKLKDVEDGFTLEENAFKKASNLYEAGFSPVFSDDTGLFLPFLDGIPGVRSSRFAGTSATYEENRKKLIETVKCLPLEKRFAYFKTVICFINSSGEVHYFTGRVEGYILTEERGENKFGYDPIFLYPKLGRTFGELPLALKNKISHRAIALMRFVNFLKNESLSL
uniref:dITP/XTP pyrophosphatase n=1 Tax=candidate division WOR-3 bacterium TaxID=2052148 RepID=A0A7C2PL84_UNCW3